MSLKGTHKILEEKMGLPPVSPVKQKKSLGAAGIAIELFCVVAAAFGPPAVMGWIFGRSEIASWAGAAFGCLAALLVWTAFSNASRSESRVEELEEMLKAVREGRE